MFEVISATVLCLAAGERGFARVELPALFVVRRIIVQNHSCVTRRCRSTNRSCAVKFGDRDGCCGATPDPSGPLWTPLDPSGTNWSRQI
jgi:hypothetical protein